MSRFIRMPTLRLPSKEMERHATWLELFFDLIFAVIISELGNRLFYHFTYIGLLQSSALFVPVMWTWASYTVFAARFDNNDSFHWVLTFVIMFAAVVMAIQIPTALEKGALGFSIGFLIAQIAILLLYSRTLPDTTTRKMSSFYMIGFGLAGISWITSLLFAPPLKFAFWILGMSIYLIIPWIGRKRILAKAPLHPTYLPERFGSFTIIILGQTIASVVFGLKLAHWNFPAVITSMLAFILAIIIWGQYYRFTQIADYKCTLSSGQPYIYVHIPLIISLFAMGVGAEKLITIPSLMNERFNTIFCVAVILYLASFYAMQCIAIRKFKIRGIIYAAGVVAVIILFFFHLSSLFTMLGLTIIFTIILGIEFLQYFRK